MRSWIVGQASISHLPTNITANIDLEAFAAAAILHDLGWSHNASLISFDKRYEVDGVNAARNFLYEQGQGEWNENRVQLVWDAIALYATIDIALHSQSLIAVLAANIGTELFSPNVTIATLEPTKVAATMEEWEAINREFPRKGISNYVKDTLVGLCRTKPNSTYGTFVADWGEKYLKEEGYT
ncbi:hypothetical protein GQ44DRAFT_804013 [Phaeosphaeriaceae sp. PMI808]|nr:hypothetical protein GQ44DRAFT_804013 [Phaeosphaeriaceae sp. PMI808]